jgi:hypothetical protein
MTCMVSDLLQRLKETSLTFWSGYYGEQNGAALSHPFNWETRLAGETNRLPDNQIRTMHIGLIQTFFPNSIYQEWCVSFEV